MMELFSKNNSRLLAANYLHNKTPLYMFDNVLDTTLKFKFKLVV